MKYTLTLLLIFTIYSAPAQEALIRNADKYFQDQFYNKAIELYKKAYDENPKSYYVIKRLALSYQRIENSVEAERWLKVLSDLGRTTPTDLFMYSEILTQNGKYQQARKILEKYATLKPDDKKVKESFNKLNYIENIIKDSASFSIKNGSINTRGAELGTCFYKNGVIFSSTSLTGSRSDEIVSEDKLPFLDLYFAEESNPGVLTDPVPFAPKLNTKFNDGPVSYDPVENLFYITQYAPKEANTESGENVFHLQIGVAFEKNKEWTFKEGFFYNNPNYSVAHPSVSSDGQMIYFVSDMPGGYGGYDIYFCYKDSDQWSEPYNLGPVVNSKGNEYFPFIDNQGNLYFSSDGHAGLGGQDIFVATSTAGVFNNIKNIGYPVNSTKDDVAFILDSTCDRGYFSSNRVESKGYYDIYSVKFNFVNVTIKGTVKDFQDKLIIAGVNIVLSDENGGQIAEAKTDISGTFSAQINKKPKIILSATAPGYEPIKKTMTIDYLKAGEELKLEVFLRKK
jgi:tetratricopeptide (TPR) repeat protein